MIAGDIGGTHARLAVCEVIHSAPRIIHKKVYPSRISSSLEEILLDYVREIGPEQVSAIALGLPCPLVEQRCRATNLPWIVSAETISRALNATPCVLINDLEALAWSIPLLDQQSLLTLHPGSGQAVGNAMVIAAGTGLGQAGLFWDGTDYRPFATEGGHCDFAPGNELDIELLRHLKRVHDHVSWERIISGPGLITLFKFHCEHQKRGQPAWFVQALAEDRAASAISEHAEHDADPLCVATLEHFIRLFGAEAGNQALKIKATGGVYIGGGIAPKLIEWMRGPQFRDSFVDKGRMQPLLEQIPIHLISSDDSALLGAARCYLERVF
ncbi:MAG: glucokinase [Candidatus Sedimenticola endophacoides]